MKPLEERLLDTLPEQDGELETIREQLAIAKGEHKVRTTFGILMRMAADARAPTALDPVRGLIDETLRSPLGMVTIAEASAFALVLGHALYPEMPLCDAGNFALERAVAENADFPLMKTLLKACDHRWSLFIRDYPNWASLVWKVPAELNPGMEQVDIIAESVGALFVARGFWFGSLQAFGKQGRCELVEHEGNHVHFRMMWGSSAAPQDGQGA